MSPGISPSNQLTLYKELYSNWMGTGEKSFTAAGNMRPPDKLLCLQWVKEAWNSVSTEVVVKSFKACGIAVATDGSEDGQIHCLKESEVGAEAAREISKLTAEMFTRGDDGEDDRDHFASCDEELETNELVVYND